MKDFPTIFFHSTGIKETLQFSRYACINCWNRSRGVSRADTVGAGVGSRVGTQEGTNKVRGESLLSVRALGGASANSLLSELTERGLTDRGF